MKATSETVLVAVVSWLARLLVMCVFLFWGVFFVEHLREWFILPFPGNPPLRVWVGQGLHFVILIGLLAALRWERVGGVLVITAAFLFLVDKTGSRFPVLFSLTVMPVLLLMLCGWQRRRNAASNKILQEAPTA